MDVNKQYKELHLKIRENEEKYISRELDLDETLEKTDHLYKQASSQEGTLAATILQDSKLMQIQTKIARQCAKNYKIDLAFDARQFSVTLRNILCPRSIGNESDDGPSRTEPMFKLWEALGKESLDKMYTVPTINYIYGIFDADPVEQVKKKHKRREKDKIGDITKPEALDAKHSGLNQDSMLSEAERIFDIFGYLMRKSKTKSMCFYEFVVDPESFTRTIENIFHVSLLIKDGHLLAFEDVRGLPFLRLVTPSDIQERSSSGSQTVLSMSMQEFQDIVRTFELKNAPLRAKK